MWFGTESHIFLFCRWADSHSGLGGTSDPNQFILVLALTGHTSSQWGGVDIKLIPLFFFLPRKPYWANCDLRAKKKFCWRHELLLSWREELSVVLTSPPATSWIYMYNMQHSISSWNHEVLWTSWHHREDVVVDGRHTETMTVAPEFRPTELPWLTLGKDNKHNDDVIWRCFGEVWAHGSCCLHY